MKPRLIPSFLIALSLLVAGLFAVRWQQAESKLRETRRWTHFVLDSLGTSVTLPAPPEGPDGRDSLYWQWLGISGQIQSRRWQESVRHWVERRATLLNEGDVYDLNRAGLSNPPRQLRDDLITHAELIPETTTHGQMMINSDEEIVLLQSPYVFAKYEDGLNGGSMLLEYSVLPGPRIQWNRLWWARD